MKKLISFALTIAILGTLLQGINLVNAATITLVDNTVLLNQNYTSAEKGLDTTVVGGVVQSVNNLKYHTVPVSLICPNSATSGSPAGTGTIIYKFVTSKQIGSFKFDWKARAIGSVANPGTLKLSFSNNGTDYTLALTASSTQADAAGNAPPNWFNGRTDDYSSFVRGWDTVYVKLELTQASATNIHYTAIDTLKITASPLIANSVVTFESNGGSAVSPISTTSSSITMPANPTKTGLTFLGWFKEATFTTPFTGSGITSNMTVYAKWGYNVTFKAPPAADIVVPVTEATTLASSAVPATAAQTGKIGFWKSSELAIAQGTLTGNVEVNAYYVDKVAPIEPNGTIMDVVGFPSSWSYYNNLNAYSSGNITSAIVTDINVAYPSTNNSEQSMVFKYRTAKPVSDITLDFTGRAINYNANTTAYFRIDVSKDNLNWNNVFDKTAVNTGTAVDGTYNFLSTLQTINVNTASAVSYAGVSEFYVKVKMLTQNTNHVGLRSLKVTTTEQASTDNYIYFETNADKSVQPAAITNGSAVLPTVTKAGVVFDGWYTDIALTTPFVNSNLVDSTIVYAKWVLAPEYTVTFNSNGGTAVTSLATRTNSVTLPTSSKYGNTLTWCTDEALTIPFDGTGVNGNMTVYAKWSPIVDTVIALTDNKEILVNHFTAAENGLTTGGNVYYADKLKYAASSFTTISPTFGTTGTLVYKFVTDKPIGSFILDWNGRVLNGANNGFIRISFSTTGGNDYVVPPANGTYTKSDANSTVVSNLSLYSLSASSMNWLQGAGGTIIGTYRRDDVSSTVNGWKTVYMKIELNQTGLDGWTGIDYLKITASPSTQKSLAATATQGGTINKDGSAFTSPTSFDLGTAVTLTAAPDAGYKFVGWKKGTKIFSTSESLTVSMTSDLALEAVFALDTVGSYTVTYLNNNGLVISTMTILGTDTDYTEPTAPAFFGHTFTEWNKNKAQIIASKANTVVTPIYTKVATKYTITVNDGTGAGLYNPTEVVTVTANSPAAGKKFSHFVDGSGKILSTKETFRFAATRDITISAIYVDDTAQVAIKPIANLTQIVREIDDTTLKFFAERSVPQGFTLIEHGVVASNIANNDGLVIGGANVLKSKASINTAEGTYIATKKNTDSSNVWNAKAYLIYSDVNGNIITIYSNMYSIAAKPQP